METVRHILQLKGPQVWTIRPDQTVLDALRLMADKNVGALVVMQADQMVGILSERDYARKVILMGKASRETLISEIMTREVTFVHPDETAQECMELMTAHHIRHLPVVEEGKLVGIISIGDVVRDIIYQQRATIKDLEDKILGKPV